MYGRVWFSDFPQSMMEKFLARHEQYRFYWTGDVISTAMAPQKTVVRIGAIMIVPAASRVKFTGQGWYRVESRAHLARLVAVVRGYRARNEISRLYMYNVYDERQKILAHIWASEAEFAAVIPKGRTRDGRRVYELTPISKQFWDPARGHTSRYRHFMFGSDMMFP